MYWKLKSKHSKTEKLNFDPKRQQNISKTSILKIRENYEKIFKIFQNFGESANMKRSTGGRLPQEVLSRNTIFVF